MEQSFKYQINSKHKLFDLHIKETFQYRDLIFLFVKRDFTALYKQTILGPLWAIIQPLLTTVVFTIVFGSLAGLTTADIKGDFIIPGFLFYMSGNICWNYFSTTLSATSNTFLLNRTTMEKVYFPRLVAPIATSISNLISFGIQFAMLMIFWLFYFIKGNTSIQLTPMTMLVPLVVIQMLILSVGVGIIISSVTTKYRRSSDAGWIWTSVMAVWISNCIWTGIDPGKNYVYIYVKSGYSNCYYFPICNIWVWIF